MRPNLFLSLLLSLGLVGCNTTYPSRRQALTACNEWKDQGKELIYTSQVKRKKSYFNEGGYVDVEIKKWNRFCKEEDITRQFLGTKQELRPSSESNRFTYEIVKNYRY